MSVLHPQLYGANGAAVVAQLRAMHGRHIIDIHNHFGALASSGGSYEDDLDGALAARADILASRGVSQTVLIASHDYLRPDGIKDNRAVNDGIAQCRARRPDLIPAAIGIVEPLNGARGLGELDRCHNELGLTGISFHTRMQGVSIDSVWVRRYLERMGELGLVPFLHAIGESSSEALWKIDVLAADFPDLNMVVLDAFSTFEQSLFVPHVAERRPNLFFDTALAHGVGFVLSLVASCGAERLLYGSDLYSWASGVPALTDVLPDILASPLTDAEKAAIVAGNAIELFGLDREIQPSETA